MKFAAATAALAATSLAAPFGFPLKDGFPSINKDTFVTIQNRAGGAYFNDVPVMKLSQYNILRLNALAAAELVEAAFFAQLYQNITQGVPGFQLSGQDKDFIIGSIDRIAATEELHAMSVNDVLGKVGQSPVAGCQYAFPVSNFQSAILLANMFTDLGLATLPNLMASSGADGGSDDGPALVPYLSAVNVQEAQQAAWFRQLQGEYPPATPFLSTSVFAFAVSAFSRFFVEGTCPAAYDNVAKGLGVFPDLKIVTAPTPKNQVATFSIQGTVDAVNNGIVYLSGQSKPVTVDITNVQQGANNQTTFTAAFPATITYDTGFVSGLTIATLSKTKRQFNNVTDLVANGNALNGPGLIEFNF